MNIKLKKLTQKIILTANKQITLAKELGATLDDYCCGFSDTQRIQQVCALCQTNLSVNSLDDLNDYISWYNEMLSAVNALCDDYQAECNDFNHKTKITNAINNTRKENFTIPHNLHQQLSQNALALIELLKKNQQLLKL